MTRKTTSLVILHYSLLFLTEVDRHSPVKGQIPG